MQILVKGYAEDLDRINRELSAFSKDIPKAMAFALNDMGFAARDKVKSTMPKYFDRPTSWVINGIRLEQATVASQQAKVDVKQESYNALVHHIEGGQRRPKVTEKRLRTAGVLIGSWQYIIPARRLSKNSYGNINAGIYQKVLLAMGAQKDPFANSTKLAGKYFVSTAQNGLPAGIFEVVGRGKNRDLKPVFLFVKKTSYSRRWPFFKVNEDAAYDAMPQAIDKAMVRILGV